MLKGRPGGGTAPQKSWEKVSPFALEDFLPPERLPFPGPGPAELSYQILPVGREDVWPCSQQPPGAEGQGDNRGLQDQIPAALPAHCVVLGLRLGASVSPHVK